MRIILDECLPRKLAALIDGYVVDTVPDAGWAGKKNGVLLGLIEEAAYDVFITADQNLQYQQNLKNTRVAIAVLVSTSLRIEVLTELLPNLQAALSDIQAGECVMIEG